MGIDFHDDEILVEAGIHRRNLALAEGIVKHRVDAGCGDAEARSGIAIDHQRLGESLILLICRGVAQLRHGAHAGKQARSPGVELS